MALPKRNEVMIEEFVERCEVIHKRMRTILREEWERTVVLAQSIRGSKRGKKYINLVKRANELARADNALRVAHCAAEEKMMRADVSVGRLPSPYKELEDATDEAVREWIMNWISEERERFAYAE